MPQWSKRDFFINPYNFVSVSLNKTSRRNIADIADEKETTHTGVLKCRLVLKTPLAVPDVENVTRDGTKQEHKIYKFFRYDEEKPVIPGSTLRGAIRSVYETATDSCFSTAKTTSVITSRSNDAFSPGVLLRDEAGRWHLYKAQRYLIKVREYKEFTETQGVCVQKSREDLLNMGLGKKVYFRPSKSGGCEDGYKKVGRKGATYLVGNYVKEFTDEKRENWKEGYLYTGEPFSKKHFESIFWLGTTRTEQRLPNIEKAMRGLEETLEVYRDEKINRNLGTSIEKHSGYAAYEKAKEAGSIPVWYNRPRRNGEKIYLTMACLGRKTYEKTMGEILNQKAPCTSREKLCKACALFGMASANEKIGSRVRITDAKAENWTEECIEKHVTLRELASPKSSYLPFYTKLSRITEVEIKNWSYDVNAEIRGRKHYWHSDSEYYKQQTDNGRITNVNKTKRNATMDLVKKGTEFTFCVYYDRVTEQQLRELIWTLTLGENCKDSKRCYKLGHGKPLGLGSAKIIIEMQEERSYKNSEYTVNKTENICVEEIFAGDSYEELMKILDMNTTQGQIVEYPRVIPDNDCSEELRTRNQGTLQYENNFASHKWFGKNYRMGGDSVQKMLPKILDSDLEMPSLEIGERDIRFHNNTNPHNGNNNSRHNGNRTRNCQ